MQFLIQDNQLIISETLKPCKTCGKPMLPRFGNWDFGKLVRESPLIKGDQIRFSSPSWTYNDICAVCFQNNHEYKVLCAGCGLSFPVDQLRMRKFTSCYEDYDTDHLCVECIKSGDKVIEFLTEGDCAISSVELFTDGKWVDWQ